MLLSKFGRYRMFTAAGAVLALTAAVPDLASDMNKVQTGKKIDFLPSPYQPQPSTSHSEAGRELFESHNCTVCHSIAGKGGCLGPVLDGIGSRRSKEFILARITNTQIAIDEFEKTYYGHQELMPHPRVPSREARLISSYLLALANPGGGYRLIAHPATAGSEQEAKKNAISEDNEKKSADSNLSIRNGRKLFYEKGCVSCHAIGDLGGTFAPRVDGIAQHRSREFVSQMITNAQLLTQNQPDEYEGRGVVMPPLNLTCEEIKDVVNFLMHLPAQPVNKRD